MASSKSSALIASARRTLRPTAAGILLSVPFWRAGYGWLVVPCVVGYIVWLTSRPSTRQIWLSGAAFFAIVTSWMWHINATDLIPNNLLSVAFLALTFLVVACGLSIGFLFFGYAVNRYKIDILNPLSLLLVPVLWAAGEWLRSIVFSVISYGPGGSIGAHWNFGSLAFPASMTPMAFGGRIVGQFGLSALVVLVSLGIVQLVDNKRWGWAAIGATVAICSAGWLLSPSASGATLRVGSLQLDDSNYSDYGYQRDLGRLTASHDPAKPLDVLVAPEYSYLFVNPEFKATETLATKRLFEDSQGLVITSRSGEATQGRDNLVTFYAPDGVIQSEQRKQFLIPGGEYIPYFYEWILVLSGNTSVIGVHQAKNTVTQANQSAIPIDYTSARLGSLACSGAIAPTYYRDLVNKGATVLTNSAALSTMGLSSGYYSQARQMAAFIAVSNARPFIQSARGAEVFMLDSNGQVIAESSTPGIHYIEGDVVTNTAKMPYSH